MPMTKKSARAIITFYNKVDGALNTLISQLDGDAKTYAENYWASQIRAIINGQGYASMPHVDAIDALGNGE